MNPMTKGEKEMKNINEIIARAKKEIEEEIKYNHYVRTRTAMDIVERIAGQSFADDEFYDDLMAILDKATENLNYLILQSGYGYYIGTRKKDVKEFIRLVEPADIDDVWNEFVEIGGVSVRLYAFV